MDDPIQLDIIIPGKIDLDLELPDKIDAEIVIENAVIGGTFTKAKVFKSDGLTLVIELDSGESFTILKHDIILPDSTIHQSDEFDEDFRLPIIYNYPPPSGNESVHRTGDELDIWQTIFNNGVLPSVGQRALADPNDFTKLLTKNAFGSFERFTNDLGGSTYDGSGGETVEYTINHYNGIAYLTLTQEFISGGVGLKNWDTHIDNALTWVQGPYSDLFLTSYDQLNDISKRGPGKAFNYPPFSISDSTPLWMSTTAISGADNQAYRTNFDAVIGDDLKTLGTRTAYYCRKHY